jgi:hypothetical protein
MCTVGYVIANTADSTKQSHLGSSPKFMQMLVFSDFVLPNGYIEPARHLDT